MDFQYFLFKYSIQQIGREQFRMYARSTAPTPGASLIRKVGINELMGDGRQISNGKNSFNKDACRIGQYDPEAYFGCIGTGGLAFLGYSLVRLGFLVKSNILINIIIGFGSR